MSADGASGDGGTKQRFELYIKASAIDKETKGSCPICQHWFMITCLLGENQDNIDFKVYTVQADCPPKNFGVDQGWSKKFPVVMVLEGRDKRGQDLTGTKYDTFEELELFFESINVKCPELKRKNAPNVAAMQAVEDVYNAFNASLSAGSPNKRLSSSLKKINDFLESDDENKYLVDDVLSFADCYLLPRLQHIRVAGKEYLDYDIPAEHTYIWKYLADAYQTEAFRSTMPSDQDIVFHYEKKARNAMQRQKRRPRPTLQNFTYTLDIPQDIADMLAGSAVAGANGDVSEPPAPPMDDVAVCPPMEQFHAPPPPDNNVAVCPPMPMADEPPAPVVEYDPVPPPDAAVCPPMPIADEPPGPMEEEEHQPPPPPDVAICPPMPPADEMSVSPAPAPTEEMAGVNISAEDGVADQEEVVVRAEVENVASAPVADQGEGVEEVSAEAAPTLQELAEDVVTADHAEVVNAPAPDGDVNDVDATAAIEGQIKDGGVDDVNAAGDRDGGDDAVVVSASDDVVVTAHSEGGVAVSDDTVGGGVVKVEVGNGDVVKDSVITADQAVVANVE
ncbi:uncharacterized protein LOC143297780 [Babylonia areolata]|uniref:uncharacterized protein LOC143297780 n=1 Tax=Babylonia areolata TaxID=304850 RepID=UPI003FD6AF48